MKKHALFYNKYCFFCQKVLLRLKKAQHDIELRSISEEDNFRELQKGGGKTQVPCLKIVDADQAAATWMYESDDILSYIVNNNLLK